MPLLGPLDPFRPWLEPRFYPLVPRASGEAFVCRVPSLGPTLSVYRSFVVLSSFSRRSLSSEIGIPCGNTEPSGSVRNASLRHETRRVIDNGRTCEMQLLASLMRSIFNPEMHCSHLVLIFL